VNWTGVPLPRLRHGFLAQPIGASRWKAPSRAGPITPAPPVNPFDSHPVRGRQYPEKLRSSQNSGFGVSFLPTKDYLLLKVGNAVNSLATYSLRRFGLDLSFCLNSPRPCEAVSDGPTRTRCRTTRLLGPRTSVWRELLIQVPICVCRHVKEMGPSRPLVSTVLYLSSCQVC